MKNSTPYGLLLIVLFCMGSFQSLFAQEEERAPADTLLPSLAPKEVEIQGELEFNFPELRRPALTGFNPPPPVFEVPLGRRPFVENYKQSGSDLPASILRKPEPPAVKFAVSPAEFQGYARLGYGRYGSSDGRGAVSIPIGSQLRLNVEGDHFGYRSFNIPGDTSNTDVSRFTNDGRISLNGNRGSGIWGLSVAGVYNRIDLNGYPKAGGFDTTVLDFPDREVLGLDTGLWIESGYETSLPYALSLSYEGTRLQTSTRDETFDVDPRLRRAQKALVLDGNLGMNSDFGRIKVGAHSKTIGLDRDGFLGNDHSTLDIHSSLKTEIGSDIIAQFGIHYLGFKNSSNFYDASVDPEQENKVGFMAAFDWVPGSRMRVYAENKPRLQAADLREMLRTNPYQNSEPAQMAEYSLINSRLGLDLYSKQLNLNVYGGFEKVNNLQTYNRTVVDPSSIESNNPQVFYTEEADVLKVGAELNAFITGLLSFLGTVEYRDVDDVPYFPSFLAQTRLSMMFGSGKGHFAIKGGYIGSRLTDLTVNNGLELPGFVNIGAETSYFFTRNLGFYAVADNMSSGDNEYWSGYFQPSFNAYGGLRFRW